VLAWTIGVLLSLIGQQACLVMTALTWPEDPCRDKEKEWFIEDGNLCTPAACWIL